MSFEGAVDLARTTFGDDIVFQSRFVSILDDFGAFRTKPSYKHILRILISASEFTHYSRYNYNEKIRFLTTITNSYGLNEDQVKTVLHKLFPSNDSIISCERNSKDTDKVNPELIILIDYSKESTNASQSIEYFLSHLLNRISNKFNTRIIYYNEAVVPGRLNNNTFNITDSFYSEQGQNDIRTACAFLSYITLDWSKQKYKPIILWLTASNPMREISQEYIETQSNNNILFNVSNRIAAYFGVSIDKLQLQSFVSKPEYVFHSLDIEQVINVINSLRYDKIIGGEISQEQPNLDKLESDRWVELSEGFAAVKKCDRWGWLSLNGEEIIPCQYRHIRPFHEGLAAVSLCGTNTRPLSQRYQWTFINILGREITINKYEEVCDFYSGIAFVCRDNLWGAIDIHGKEVISCRYHNISYVSDQILKVSINKMTSTSSSLVYGYINFKGNVICPIEYNDVSNSFWQGYAIVQKDGENFVINNNGIRVSKIPFWRGEFLGVRGLIKVFQKNNKVGVVSLDGVVIVQPIYDKIHCCKNIIDNYCLGGAKLNSGHNLQQNNLPQSNLQSENLIVAERNNHCILFDCAGKEIISEEYDKIVFYSGIIIANKNNHFYLYTLEGRRLQDKVLDRVVPYKNNLIVREAFKTEFMIIDNDGKTIPIPINHCKYTNQSGEQLSVKYDDIVYAFENGSLLVGLPRKASWQSKAYAIINRDGIMIQWFRSYFDLRVHSILGDVILKIEEVKPTDEYGMDLWRIYDHYMHFFNLNTCVQICRSKDTNGKTSDYPFYPQPSFINYSEGFFPLDLNRFLLSYPVTNIKSGECMININTGLALKQNDSNGNSAIQIFQDIGPMREERAYVKDSDKFGFINTQGETIIPIQYDWASSFQHGFALVKSGNEIFKINKRGEIICKFRCNEIKYIQFGKEL